MLPPTLGVQTSSIVPHWADCWTSPSAGTICIPMSEARGFIRFPNPSIFDKRSSMQQVVNWKNTAKTFGREHMAIN